VTDRAWLVRHASTEWTGHRWCGRTDVPLSAAGRAEAAALATRLAAIVPSDAWVLASPLRRAKETANAITKARASRLETGTTQEAVELIGSLIEVDFGAVDGRTWSEVERDMPELASGILAGRDVDWPEGEAAEAVRLRVSSVCARVEASSRPVVLVSHSAVLAALAGALTRSPILARTALAPAAVLALRREGRTWRGSTGRT
jgi:broad specificity phosphatase PhoE